MTEARLKLLVYKFLSESLTEEEKKELFAAAEEHPEIWDLIKKLQDTEQLLRDLKEIQDKEESSKAKILILKRPAMIAAACIALLMIAGGISYFRRRQTPFIPPAIEPATAHVAYRIDSSARGKFKQIVLPDGSHLLLSSASTIRYPVDFSGPARDVSITGEAYFDIAKDPARPFHVQTDHLSIEVLGTRFDVRAYAGDSLITATVTDGSVKAFFKGQAQVLHPKDQLTFTSTGADWFIHNDVDTSLSTIWTKGSFRFVNADIPTVMRELGSWYGVHFDIRVPPNTCTIDGPFSRSLTLPEILHAIQQKNLHFEFNGDTIIVR